nr:glycosyltransferase family 2 protein [uncultured Dyadobacter sp.]
MIKYKSIQNQQISIILPCFNPPVGWIAGLLGNISTLNGKLPDHEIQYIISNDGSTSLERNEVAFLSSISGIVFVDNIVNEGKGSAIRKGSNYATGELIIYTDIDFPFGTDPIVEMVEIFNRNPGCCFIYGNRSMEYFENLPLKRRVFSKILMFLNRMILTGSITDTQAGVKGFRRQILPVVQGTRTNTFVFEIELIRKLVNEDIGVERVDVFADPSIVFTDFSFNVLFKEAVNFARIFTAPNADPRQ